jgi:hypothetical protein
MRGAPAWLIITAMDETRVIISLDLRLVGDALTGTAAAGDGAKRSFSGWIGLVAAIDALVPPCSLPTSGDTAQGGQS